MPVNESTVIDALRDVLGGLTSPSWDVHVGPVEFDAISRNTIALIPVAGDEQSVVNNEPERDGELLLVLGLIAETPTDGDEHGWTEISAAVRQVRQALRTHATLQPGGGEGVTRLRQERWQYFWPTKHSGRAIVAVWTIRPQWREAT